MPFHGTPTFARNGKLIDGHPSEHFCQSCNLWFHRFHLATLEVMTDVTNILGQIEAGDPSAAEKLLPLVYEELRKLASSRMKDERFDHTLQATALVHEAYVRLVDVEKAQKWNSRGHFFGAAAEAMRRILVDRAREKQSAKRGGEVVKTSLSENQIATTGKDIDLIALDEALHQLTEHDSRKAEIVKLRYFVGMTIQEAAEVLGISESTADADWAYAKSWLRVRVSG